MRLSRLFLLLWIGLAVASCSDGSLDTEFTQHRTGGYLFSATNADETVRLGLVADWDAARAGDPPTSAPVPGAFWSGELVVGHDLFVNFGDGLDDEVDEQTLIDERWSVVSGTITIEGGYPPPCGLLEARATGLVLESDDGRTMNLDRVDLRNREWGCEYG